MNMGNIFNNFLNNMAYLERIFETMGEKVTVADAENATEMPPSRDMLNLRMSASHMKKVKKYCTTYPLRFSWERA